MRELDSRLTSDIDKCHGGYFHLAPCPQTDSGSHTFLRLRLFFRSS